MFSHKVRFLAWSSTISFASIFRCLLTLLCFLLPQCLHLSARDWTSVVPTEKCLTLVLLTFGASPIFIGNFVYPPLFAVGIVPIY